MVMLFVYSFKQKMEHTKPASTPRLVLTALQFHISGGKYGRQAAVLQQY